MSSATTFDESKVKRGQPGNAGQFASQNHCDPLGVCLDPKDVFHTRYDTMEEKLEAFRGELRDAVDALDGDAEWQSYLDAMAKFHHYSFNNRLLIALQGGTGMVGGFRTWSELGRHVKAGEKGIQIFAPKTVRVDETDEGGAPVLDEDGKPVKTRKCVGFTTASVFDVSQTEGDPIPSGWDHLCATPPDGYIEDLEVEAARRGFPVVYEEIDSEARGFTRPPSGGGGTGAPSLGSIVIDSRLGIPDRAATLSHELGHIVAGHLDPEHLAEYRKAEHRGVMEVEAESIGYVLDRANGFDDQAGKRASAQYLKGWSQASHDPEVVEKAAGRVDRGVMELLKGGGFRNVDVRGGSLPGSGRKKRPAKRRRSTH
jgi:hypothetical protein